VFNAIKSASLGSVLEKSLLSITRDCLVHIGLTESVTVTQAGATPYLSVTPPNQDVSSVAGNTTFDISSNISWSVTDDADWLTVSPINGSNNETITADYEENTTIDSRTATITISGNGLTETVTVTQAGATPYLSVTPSNYDVGVCGALSHSLSFRALTRLLATNYQKTKPARVNSRTGFYIFLFQHYTFFR